MTTKGSGEMIEILRQRRSIRAFTPQPIEAEKIRTLQEAVLRAPSSRNLDSRRIVFVTDAALLGDLSHAKPQHADFLAGAPLGVAVCGDGVVSDVWIEDCAIAAATLQYTATSLGLGSCWIQIRGREDGEGVSAEQRVREMLELPETLQVDCIIAVGYAAQEKEPRDEENLYWESLSER